MSHPGWRDDVPGEIDPRDLRISDLDREQATGLLAAAMEQGRITPVEFSERCRTVWAARIRAELLEVLADLPGGPPPQLAPLVLDVAFGQVRRTGRWPVPELVRVAGMGQRTMLDFTEAAIARPEVVIEVSASMSATTVVLPADAVVDTDGLELVAGSVRHRGQRRADRADRSRTDRSLGGLLRGWRSGGRAGPEPNPVRFVLRGRVVLSSVTIWHPRPARRR